MVGRKSSSYYHKLFLVRGKTTFGVGKSKNWCELQNIIISVLWLIADSDCSATECQDTSSFNFERLIGKVQKREKWVQENGRTSIFLVYLRRLLGNESIPDA